MQLHGIVRLKEACLEQHAVCSFPRTTWARIHPLHPAHSALGCMSVLSSGLGSMPQIAKEETSQVASYWVAAELRRLLAEEREWRCRLWSQGAQG